jgi:very-short-patch-repair endonuclease
MTTNVVLSSTDRNLFGITIRQETQSGFLNLSDLKDAYTRARIQNGWVEKNIDRIMTDTSFRVWFENMFNIPAPNLINAKFLKSNNLYKTTGARQNKTTYCHHEIWSYVYERMFEISKPVPYYSYANKFLDILNKVFNGILPFVNEYKVGNYKVDIYFDSLNLCVEFDENYHDSKSQIEKDTEREDFIKKALNCKFVRVKIGEELEGIRNILLAWKSENIKTVADIIF